jgi:thioredoxin reductase (NADPH)
MTYKTIIIGTGPAGLTSAIYLARANMEPLVIEGWQPGGQLTTTTEVENFPGFPDGILGSELMSNMRKQAQKFGATFKIGSVKSVDFSKRPYTLDVEGLGELKADSVIISTGASAKYMNIPGEQDNIGRGVSTCATCDGFFFRGKKIIVVGGGDSAMEEAVFLTRFASEVRLVHRRDELRASKIMQDRARANDKIVWSLNRTPVEVVATGMGLQGLKVLNNETGEEELLETDGLFVTIGHTPNTGFLGGHVQDRHYRQAITAAGSGCMAALDCERFLESQTHEAAVV